MDPGRLELGFGFSAVLSSAISRMKSTWFGRTGSTQNEGTRTKSATNITQSTSWISAADELRRSNVNLNEQLIAAIEEASSTKSSDVAFDELKVFKEPMCLVRKEEGNKLKIEEKTVEQINQIPFPMVIVTVVGLYRTGKSYLMNRLATSEKGFAVGDTLESKTKGVWIVCNIHPKKSNTVLVLLDTEGLAGIEEGDVNFDNKLFTLATLLCNCLVYNMRGAFDQDAVSKLTFITEISNSIRYRGTSSHKNQDLSCTLPRFILCLRDFTLKMVKDGIPITEDEYLEKSLKEQKGKDKTFNKPRECIRKYFPVRKCFAMPCPGDSDDLEKKPFNELPPKFKKACGDFVTYVHSLPPKELLANKIVTGPIFTALASCYVKTINKGAIPDVEDAFLASAKFENKRIKENALKFFQECMCIVDLPVPSKCLEEINKQAQLEALAHLRKKNPNDKDRHYVESAQKEMDSIWGQREKENKEKIRALCDEKLKDAQACTPLKESIENKLYHKAPGGHKRFRRDLKQTEDEFMRCLLGYEKHEIALAWFGFLETLKTTEYEIIKADEELTLQETEDERKRFEKSLTEENERKLEEQKKLLTQIYDELKETVKEKDDTIKKLESAKDKLVNYYKQKEQERKNRWFWRRFYDAALNQ